jgi:uncharacterized protein YecT (DUF1311 family)
LPPAAKRKPEELMVGRRVVIALAALAALCGLAGPGLAQERKPTPKEIAAIRACAGKHEDNVAEAERRCLFNLVATPCSKRPQGRSEHGAADCYRVEQEIWTLLLDENLKALNEELDADQKKKLDAMQGAWALYRNSTCEFYYDKIQGSMATSMIAACLARETARRALLIDFFRGL